MITSVSAIWQYGSSNLNLVGNRLRLALFGESCAQMFALKLSWGGVGRHSVDGLTLTLHVTTALMCEAGPQHPYAPRRNQANVLFGARGEGTGWGPFWRARGRGGARKSSPQSYFRPACPHAAWGCTFEVRGPSPLGHPRTRGARLHYVSDLGWWRRATSTLLAYSFPPAVFHHPC